MEKLEWPGRDAGVAAAAVGEEEGREREADTVEKINGLGRICQGAP
jgi:hypothetical protein